MLWVADPGTRVYPGYTQTHRPLVQFSRVWVWVGLTYPGDVLRVQIHVIRDVDPRGCDRTRSIASLTSVMPQVHYYSQ